jgi:tetratricopeptide (TPR) repeat protein
MKLASLVFAVAGMAFGLIVGWVLGVQQAESGRAPAAVAQQAAAAAPADSGGQTRAVPLDENKVKALRDVINADPKNHQARVQLGNLYFDAERYEDATEWYNEALKIEPRDPDVSTDLGVSYYYLNQPDRALKQFDHSLSINPKHAKTILNQGIVLAFGKQDLEGAAASWRKVVEVAPGSPEAEAARRALEGMKQAHPSVGGAPPSGGSE